MRILIADDEPIPRRLLEASLARAGYQVVAARDGEEAWQMLQSEDAPRLAILDWLMPGLDGVEVCRRIRQRTDVPYVYIVLLTSKDRKEDVIEGMEAGADDYLTKPFDPQELHVRLRAGQRIIDLETELMASLKELAQARQREVETGARIQQTLLLGQPPRSLPGVRVAALTIPSQHIDGDFYDFFNHNNRCLDVVVGDVMGKGVPAALLSAAIKSRLLHAISHLIAASETDHRPEPEEIVTRVHEEVTREFIGLEFFATLCYARFDLEKSQVLFVDCGHTKTIHYERQADRFALLQGDNLPLGVSEREVYAQRAAPFGRGDLFVFYSDGVTEARSETGEILGVARLMEIVRENSHLDPDALLDRVRAAVVAFSGAERFADDFTCVAVQIMDAAEARSLAHAERKVTSDLAELTSIRAFVQEFCHSLPDPSPEEERVEQLILAVNEAASNIMRHAYQGRTDRPIHLEADAFADRIQIQLRHQGRSFDPATSRPPAFDGSRQGGFGVYMIARSVDEVRYFQDEQGRNCIRLVKKRKEEG